MIIFRVHSVNKPLRAKTSKFALRQVEHKMFINRRQEKYAKRTSRQKKGNKGASLIMYEPCDNEALFTKR